MAHPLGNSGPAPRQRATGLRNVLFIMADQLRYDYLSCAGHRTLQTPNIDALAARGTRFEHCYVQAPVCGPSRMSTYSGRYMSSHGATWNFLPLSVSTPTLADHLRPAGARVAVVGKTHVAADQKGMERLGIDLNTREGVLLGQGGFEPYARHDGVVADRMLDRVNPPYNRYLQSRGYEARNAWHDHANSALGAAGEVLSGWQMRHAALPARVADEHSESAWTTDRSLDFIREQGDAPWCLHVSYIKPHWPYIVSAPYHGMYGAGSIQPPVRSTAERGPGENPVLAAFRQHPESLAFSRDEVRETVVPTYMALVRQLDEHVGRLMRGLQELGRLHDTLVVFTSDHGDMLGDHWLGEKEMFYDASARVPLIIVDPSSQARGQVHEGLVEAIDLLPTFVDALGLPGGGPWLEGRSLMDIVQGCGSPERDCVFSELDYAFYDARRHLGIGVNDARATMARTQRWKYVRFEGFAPLLYDMQADPEELADLGSDPAMAAVRADMEARIAAWRTRLRQRTSLSDEEVAALGDRTHVGGGVRIGEW